MGVPPIESETAGRDARATRLANAMISLPVIPTSLNCQTLVTARTGPTSGRWVKEPMSAVCHGEQRSDVATHLTCYTSAVWFFDFPS